MGSVLFWRRISSLANEKRKEKPPRAQVGVLFKHLCEKKEFRDSVDGGGSGDGTSMVLGEGKKPSGEEVSYSILLLLY
jgi:hypothetical protein